MQEQEKQNIKENISDSNTWLRILFVILYTFVYFLARYIVLLIVVINAISNLISGKSFESLNKFAKQLNVFIFQCMEYITFVSNVKPYPFTAWTNEAGAEAMHDKAQEIFAKESQDLNPKQD